ncbi:sensor histidine kinase [Catelliglobosispora koreensis]|uniref:sensor histidine kinase n=1 Tax=Catelliglobosispora koreensis TaxID=129052 RepID=UPI0003757231|nr:nitrate- and nitrite sensing domain-containing protein [Catelliglobosispora koreensis]
MPLNYTAQPGKSALRKRILAVLASLVALWAFAAYVTVGEGISLVWLATLEQQVAKPTETLVAALQQERRAAAERSGLDSARAATDAAIQRQLEGMRGQAAQWATSSASDERLEILLRALDGLPEIRAAENDVTDRYTAIIQLGLDVYDTYTAWDDDEVIYQTSTLVLLTHSQEMLSRADALLSRVILGGTMSEQDRIRFSELTGAQRYLSRQVVQRLPQPDKSEYETLLGGAAMTQLRAVEGAAALGDLPTREQWRSAVEAVIAEVRALVLKLADLTVERVRPAAIWIFVRLILAAGLGLIAVIASIRFAIRGWQSLQRQLHELRVAALDLAQVRLPAVVDQLRRGEQVSVAQAAPPLAYGDDDIGQVGQAFNMVQQTAIEATVEQAELRRGVREVFLSLAHRIQALIHRQLKLIDSMERLSTTDKELADLYRIDHLATRIRRNAENLIVLSGAPAGRTWRGPVPMVDVLRGAVAEVEDYPRVRLEAVAPAALSGHAVGDVIHLLAELMDNAASFSSPQSRVIVRTQATLAEYQIEIEDSGIGMTDADLAQANQQLADPPEFQLSATARLGFFVVGKLSLRYGIRVSLKPSSGRGLTAVILMPQALLRDTAPLEPTPELVVAAAPAAVAVAPEAEFTPAGLPWRARKAAVPAPREPGVENGQSPEDVSRRLAAFASAVKKAPLTERRAEQ